MGMPGLAPLLTPHGHLLAAPQADAPALPAELEQRLGGAFALGAGHGLLLLGAEQVGTILPPAWGWWRDFAARYVSGVCALPEASEIVAAAPEDQILLSLIEDAQRTVDRVEAEKFAHKLKSGKGFDLEDFKQQIGQMKKMGGVSAMLDKLPGQLAQVAGKAQMDDRQIRRIEGIINSMTPQERAKPELLKASRKRRIAAGAGVSVQEVNRLLAQFEQTQKMMKMMAKGGMAKMMRSMKGMLPGGMR